MTPAARVQTAITLLEEVLAGAPAEQVLTRWARRSRFAGSKDRAAVRDHVYDALRQRRSSAARGGALTGRGLMLGLVRGQGGDVDAVFDGSAYGPPPPTEEEQGRAPAAGAEACDIPDWLWPEFVRSLGAEVETTARYLQQRAPVFLRANLARQTPDSLIQRLADEGITARRHAVAQSALEVTEGARRLRQSVAFTDGSFELQDVASQAVVEALPLSNGDRVLDFCAGGGGKTLAMGASAKVELWAHDRDPRRMADLPARAERAGLRVHRLSSQEVAAEGPFDLVLCDVPCSGSGSWRRAPDGKWTLTPERLAQLTQTQDAILDQVVGLVAARASLAYVTCSVLRAENEDRIDAFLDRHADWRAVRQTRWPLSGGGDGFFLTLLTRNSV